MYVDKVIVLQVFIMCLIRMLWVKVYVFFYCFVFVNYIIVLILVQCREFSIIFWLLLVVIYNFFMDRFVIVYVNGVFLGYIVNIVVFGEVDQGIEVKVFVGKVVVEIIKEGWEIIFVS